MRPIEKDNQIRMAFTMTTTQDAWVREEAAKQKLSMSEFIRCTLEQKRDPKALKAYLKNKKLVAKEDERRKKEILKAKAEKKKAKEKKRTDKEKAAKAREKKRTARLAKAIKVTPKKVKTRIKKRA